MMTNNSNFHPSSLTESISASRLDAVTQLLNSIQKGQANGSDGNNNANFFLSQEQQGQDRPDHIRRVFSPHPDNPNRIKNPQNSNHHNNNIPTAPIVDYSQLHAAARLKAEQRQLQAQQKFSTMTNLQNSNSNANLVVPPSMSHIVANYSAASPSIPQHNFNSGYYGYLYLPNNENNQGQQLMPQNNNMLPTTTRTSSTASSSERSTGNWSDIDAVTVDGATSAGVSEIHRHPHHQNKNIKTGTITTMNTSKREKESPTNMTSPAGRKPQQVFTASRKKPESPELSHPRKRTARPEESMGSIGYAFTALAAHKKRQAEADLRAIKYDELLRQPVSPTNNINNNRINGASVAASAAKTTFEKSILSNNNNNNNNHQQQQKNIIHNNNNNGFATRHDFDHLPSDSHKNNAQLLAQLQLKQQPPLPPPRNANASNNYSNVIQEYPNTTAMGLAHNNFESPAPPPMQLQQSIAEKRLLHESRLVVSSSSPVPQQQQQQNALLSHQKHLRIPMNTINNNNIHPNNNAHQQYYNQEQKNFSPSRPSLVSPLIQNIPLHNQNSNNSNIKNNVVPSPIPPRKSISVDDFLYQKALEDSNNNIDIPPKRPTHHKVVSQPSQQQKQKQHQQQQHHMSDSVDDKIFQLLQSRILNNNPDEDDDEVMYEKDYERKLIDQEHAELEHARQNNNNDPEIQMLRKILGIDSQKQNSSSNGNFVASASSPNKNTKFVFNDSDGSFLQVAMPNLAHETRDHRTLLSAVAHEPEKMLEPDRGSPQGKMNTRHENVSDENSFDSTNYLSVGIPHNKHADPSTVSSSSANLLFSRPEQHRISGMNDSFAFAQKSRIATKKESYNNPENFQQNSLAGKELLLAGAGQVETTKNRTKNDALNEVAPDLALAHRDFASRAQMVRQKVTETRVLMALKAIRDTEERERLVLRAAEAIERGTHHLLVKHLGNRIKYIAEEIEERERIAKLRQLDLLFVGKKVRHRKEEDEMRKRIADDQQEGFRKLLRNLQKTLESHFAMMKLVQEIEPRHRQFLVSESIQAMNFLLLRSCELMEEKHRAFLMVGYWCPTDESLEQVQDQFEEFFESSASARRVRGKINHRNKNGNNHVGWIGPAVPSRGQFCDDYHDSIVSGNHDADSSLFGRYFKNNNQNSGSSNTSSFTTNRNGKVLSDAEIIFAELNRAARRLFSSTQQNDAKKPGDSHHPQQNGRRRHNPPVSPAQSFTIFNDNNNNKHDNITSTNTRNENQIDRQNSLHPLWSAAEGAKRAQLSAQISALRRGEDLTVSAFSSRHYRGPGGYLEDYSTNFNNDPTTTTTTRDRRRHDDPQHQSARNDADFVYSSSAPDNFGPTMRLANHKQEINSHLYSSSGDHDEDQEDLFVITSLEGLHFATSAVLSWHGWLPVSLYYSVVIPFARLLRDEAVSRLALEEGQEVKLQSLLAFRAVDIGNRMSRALKSQGVNAAMKLASTKVEKVPVRLFGNINNNSNNSPNSNKGNKSNSSYSRDDSGNDDSNQNNNSNNVSTHDISSIALRHDLKMFRLGDPDRQGVVSFPSTLAVLRSSPEFVGVGKDVFSCCTTEELAVMFMRNSSSNNNGQTHRNDEALLQQVSTVVLTFPEFRNFMQHLRQVLAYY